MFRQAFRYESLLHTALPRLITAQCIKCIKTENCTCMLLLAGIYLGKCMLHAHQCVMSLVFSLGTVTNYAFVLTRETL